MDNNENHETDRSVRVSGDMVGSAVVTGDNNFVKVLYQTLSGKEAIEEADSIRNLKLLLHRVKTIWIKGVLQRVVSDANLNVQLRSAHESVQRPFEGNLGFPEQHNASETIEKISDSFDESGGLLLILGQPGAGKTVSLLELTEALVQRAEQDIENPVPVVLLLSSWPGQKMPVQNWIEEELSSQYQIPKDVGHIWLKRRRILPLFDGLDEIETSRQPAFINAVHEFLQEVGVPGMAISCRENEYENLPVRLKLGGAVCLQPLSAEQARDQFVLHSQNRHLVRIFDQHETLQQVAKSPLMLGIMKTVFENSSPGDSVDSPDAFETVEECHSLLFEAYIDRMMGPATTETSKEQSQFLNRLSWFGKKMTENHSSIFLIEDLQPSWLTSRRQRITNQILGSIITGLLTGIATILFAIGCQTNLKAMNLDPLSHLWFLVQLPFWFLGISFLEAKIPLLSSKAKTRWQAIGGSAIKIVLLLAIWMLWPLGWMLVSGGNETTGPPFKDWFISNTICGLITCSFVGSYMRDHRATIDIRTVEALGISIKKALRGAMFGMASGFAIYITYLLFKPPECFPWFWQNSVELFVSIAYTILGGVVGFCIGGVVSRIDESKVKPNQGIRLSRQNALVSGLTTGTLCGLTAFGLMMLMTLVTPRDYSFAAWVYTGLGIGVLTGFYSALWFGGWDVIKHYILRAQLVAVGLLPRKLGSFLGQATRSRFLRRVGGGFMFIHGLLREHFAERDQATAESLSSVQSKKR